MTATAQHLMLALEAKSDRSAAMDELKALLTWRFSRQSLEKISDLLQVWCREVR